MEGEKTKWCPKGKHYVVLSGFSSSASSKDGLQGYCKDCSKKYQNKYYQETKPTRLKYHRSKKRKAKRKELMAAWHLENPEANRTYRARQRALEEGVEGPNYTPEEWRAICIEYEYHCLCCMKQEPEIKLDADHVIPLHKGGNNSIDNIQPLCGTCNKKKGTKAIDYRPKWWRVKGGQLVEDYVDVFVFDMILKKDLTDSFRWQGVDSTISVRLPKDVYKVPPVNLRVTVEEVSQEEVDEGFNDEIDEDGEGIELDLGEENEEHISSDPV
jgi:5-methylcytosine-specific restriction protein A